MATLSSDAIIQQLDQAKELVFSNSETFPQVLRQILNFTGNNDLKIQRWCAKFLKDSFGAEESVIPGNTKVELAMDSINSLVTLLNVPDLEIFKTTIDTSVMVFKLVFQFVANNDGSGQVWTNLNELKNTIISKFNTTYPLPESDNEEHDLMRNIDTKLEILKFIIVVIDYQSRSNNNIHTFSLSKVNPGHTLIKANVVEQEAAKLLDLVLKNLTLDIIIPQLVTATINHLIVIAKKKQQFVNKILAVIENYESNNKLQSNYQSVEQFKLAKKYVDRVLKVFINHMLRNNLVPTNLQLSLNKKLSLLIDRGADIRKKNIFALEDKTIRKRKFEGFLNPSKKVKSLDYKNLYCLTDPKNELNNFDLGALPQQILVSMALAALNKVSTKKLTKALEIISERYKNAVNDNPVKQEFKSEFGEQEEDEDEKEENFNPTTVYTLPPPKELSFQEKKDHINIIIRNFFKLAARPVSATDDKEVEGPYEKLTKVAIKSWKKDSWFVLLTRLATRGMRTVDFENSTDFQKNEEMSDMIRTAIFDYFLENIHNRIDLIIEWLNEEWYSEKVFNEEKMTKELTEKYAEEDSKTFKSKADILAEIENTHIPTPTYDKWSSKVLDSMIPFLEVNDRKIFIRLLSDLPYLNDDLVSRIKSLCFDPARSKIGFLSLQFLIMFRPPVNDSCIKVLQELTTSDQEDLKEEALKLLQKYT